MRGTFIERPAKDGFHWRKYRGDPHLYLSIFDMKAKDAVFYSQLMEKYHISYLHSFPSSAKTFYKLLDSENARRPAIRKIFTSSETLTESDRGFIQESSGAQILDLYGASERVAMAGECHSCGQYHAYPQYGYFELLDESGNPVTSEGSAGSIIGTSYNRMATPLLRYEIGDMAVLSRPRGICGRSYVSLTSILGRSVDYAISATGREVSMSMMNMHSKEFDSIIRFQFLQKEPGSIEFHYIPGSTITDGKLDAIEGFVASKLGDGFKLKMVARDHIPRCKNGKHKLIVHSE
jgi:phenylacetate-CoA ligase